MFAQSGVTRSSESTVPVITPCTLSLQSQRRKSRFGWGLFFGLLLTWGVPNLWHHEHPVDTAPVHFDQTVVKISERQVPQKVTLIYQNQNGQWVRILADAERYSEFVRTHAANLETQRQQLREQVKTQFEAGMNTIFQDIQGRIPSLADWYFSYGTSYQLLWEAITSVVSNLGAENIKKAVAADIENLIQRQYEYRVLKPELTDPKVQQLYQQTLEQTHQSYLKVLGRMGAEFQVFVSKHTPYLEPSPQSVPELHLDWISQIHKLRIASDAASSLGVFRGITLTTLGAITGKALGSQVGAVIAARLALPFVERALLTVTGGTTGAGSGSLGGPIGATVGVVVGATVALAVDWAVQQGVEMLSRTQFEKDVQEVVNSTNKQWQNKLLPSLLQSVDVKFEDTLQLLSKF